MFEFGLLQPLSLGTPKLLHRQKPQLRSASLSKCLQAQFGTIPVILNCGVQFTTSTPSFFLPPSLMDTGPEHIN